MFRSWVPSSILVFNSSLEQSKYKYRALSIEQLNNNILLEIIYLTHSITANQDSYIHRF